MNFLLLATLVGCKPDHANVSGDWFAWLAASSSPTVLDEKLSLDAATVFECSGRGWDPDTCMFDPGYIGPTTGHSEIDNIIGGDCARTNRAENPNFNPEEGKCDGDFTDACNEEDLEAFALECEKVNNIEKNTWIRDDGYYALSGEIDSWRSEALINSEGDLQLTIHVDIGEGEDFRFAWSIDPDFSPNDCLEDENGDLYRDYVDGSDWLNEWSEDEEGNLIYYLNTGAYQVDPSDSEKSWYLSNDMLSGYSFAKFGSEEFSSHPTEYGHYDLNGSPLPWGGGLAGGFLGMTVEGHAGEAGEVEDQGPDSFYDPADETDWYEQYVNNLDVLCNTALGRRCETFTGGDNISWEEEISLILGAVRDDNANGTMDDGESRFEHKIESNIWRPLDNTVSGLDGWMEVHSSWVRLQTGQKVAPGEKVKGDYQIFYEGTEAGSRLLVRGEFEITELEMDEWGYEILEDAKREANGTTFCDGASAPE